ncbi:TetR/AcrR family transcriptional regulator C-terminal domain-containing protein [Spelaeicoccus albus]|uniref:AcrR family transcriptional regulator n=1 Tax=Spelaeicoccus albus TaxID=1280376 RepID=A0A7Z0A9H3_9MICO|nr:TetR/AcrR family transcriptional regulator C-terminal domain-containing protein [Spelaeicoccus albus]NYI66797.1 AcrR family transcriptional regulator [Spelaeicoccus albus]
MPHHDGSRVKLTRSDICSAALRIVDRDGLGHLTMRRVAAELGVEAMSLYHHVPNKAALLDGIVEQVIALTPHPFGHANDWRTALRDFAGLLRQSLIAHRSVVPLIASRPAITPRNLSSIESALTMLVAEGFTPGAGLRIIRSTVSLVLGHVVVETAPLNSTEKTDDSHSTGDPTASIDPGHFPLLVAGTNEIEPDSPEDRFALGIDAMLAGFEREKTG